MGLRFRKTIKILPGVKINLCKSGITTTIGVRGASVNIGKHGARGTVGIPGTGISYSEKLSELQVTENHLSQPVVQNIDPPRSASSLFWLIVIIAIAVVVFQILEK